MADSGFISGRGLDIGTSYIICAREYSKGNKIAYSEFRDAFFRLVPSSPISKKMIEKGLKGQQYFHDIDGSFIVLGQDAIERAIERNKSANRPLVKGVISPKEKQARRILKHIFKETLGDPIEPGEKVVFTIPAQPVDQQSDDFDVGYHADALSNDLKDLGYTPQALNEAEAICYSELEDDDYTGLSMSFGAGMCNVCLMSAGEGVLHWSTCRSGDWVDRMAAQATASEDTVVQVEKENNIFKIGDEVSGNGILTAVSLYYIRLIDYTIKHLIAQLNGATKLPKFTQPLPIVIAGGTSKANGFIDKFAERLTILSNPENPENGGLGKLPFEVKEVRHAKDPLRSVARGCLLSSQL